MSTTTIKIHWQQLVRGGSATFGSPSTRPLTVISDQHDHMEATIEVYVDEAELARLLGIKAAMSKGRKSRAFGGAIIVLAHDVRKVKP